VEVRRQPLRRAWKIARAPVVWMGPQAAKSGGAVARRTVVLLFIAVGQANAAGAIVVFVFSVWVVPSPSISDATVPILVNLVALVVFLTVALLIGFTVGLKRLRPVRDWLRSDRAPTAEEMRLVLRAPINAALIAGTLWALATVVFAAINITFSGALAVFVAITVALGGVTTCAAAYLLTERVMRAATARALEAGPPRRPNVPRKIARSLLAFALGAGVPLLGMLLIGVYALADEDVTRNQLSIVILGLGGCALLVGLFMSFVAARAAADPVMSVRDAVAEVEKGNLDDVEVPVYDATEVGLLQAGFNRMVEGLRERRRIREAFGVYVDHEVAEHILEEGVSFEGEEVDVTLMFIDVKDFTRWAEDTPAAEVVERLNGLFDVAVPVIHDHRGHVDKFVGDGLLAVFGAPQRSEEHADEALKASLEIVDKLADAGPDELDVGIGLNSGLVVAGNVGGGGRLEFSVMGDAVNVASRIEGATRDTGDPVLLSEETAERLKGDYELEPRDDVELKGKSEPVRLLAPRF
jgi:adenylate cyclase